MEGNPNDFPLVLDLDNIAVGDVFRVENILLNVDDEPEPLTINVLASFTGYQSHSEDGEVQIQVKILKLYYPQDISLRIELAIIGQEIWIVKQPAQDLQIRALVSMIEQAKNPTGPEYWS